jgi:hypothetical protein
MVTPYARTRLRSPLHLVAATAIVLGASTARAQSAPPAESRALTAAPPAPPPAPHVDRPVAEPRAHHEPVVTAKAHEDLRIAVTFEHGESVRWAGVVFRSAKGELKMAPLLRGETEGYVAIIPGEEVVSPGIAYAIEIERVDGRRVAAFASRDDLQPIQIMEDRMDVRERASMKRLEGRRSVVTASGELVRFGTTTGKSPIPCAAKQSDCAAGQPVIPTVDDQYWRVEAGYTYRPMRYVAEFGLKIGVVRGTSLVNLTTYDASKYKVGLNYATPSVRFRMHDLWHLDLAVVASITEIGFSFGGGGALLIGDPLGTHVTFGAEAVGVTKATYFGSRFYTRVDVQVAGRVTLAPVIEVTDMPHADAFGVRLYGDASVYIGRGFSLGVRGGYQARRSTSGGPGVGGTASFAF